MVEKPLSVINLIYMVFPILFLPIALFVYYPISQKLGFRGVICIALVFILSSLWFRVRINSSVPYLYTLVSSILNASALPLYLHAIPLILPLWFAPEEVCPYFTLIENKG